MDSPAQLVVVLYRATMANTGTQLRREPSLEKTLNPHILDSFHLPFNPFARTANGRSVPLIPASHRAFGELLEGVVAHKGLLLLTGEVGTGKSTVLQQLRLALAERSVRTVFVFNPLLDTRNFFDFVSVEFGIRPSPSAGANAFTSLSEWLYARHREGATVALIIDEAQGLSTAVLQALGFVLNVAVSGETLMQVVLAGQPELNDKLRAPELRQIRQRIAVRCRTSALTQEDAHQYVEQRLRAAGLANGLGFSREAVESAHFYSNGIPRVMNLLCEHALMNACKQRVLPVAADMIEEAAREYGFDDARPLGPRRRLDQRIVPSQPADAARALENRGAGQEPSARYLLPLTEIRRRDDAVQAEIANGNGNHAKALVRAEIPVTAAPREQANVLPFQPTSMSTPSTTVTSAVDKSLRLLGSLSFAEVSRAIKRMWASLLDWMNQPMHARGSRRGQRRR